MTQQNSLPVLFSVLTALTGLTKEDVLEQALAETPEEQERLNSLNLRKMTAHRLGVPLSEVPDFIAYPDTGFPPKEGRPEPVCP